jgi:hypothetical protein
MNSIAPSNKPVVAIVDNMDAMMLQVSKANTRKHHLKQNSCRTLGETVMSSEISSTGSLEEDELHDVCEPTVMMVSKPLTKVSKPTTQRSSILKPCTQEIPISLKPKAFKTLPPPDITKIKRTSLSVAVNDTTQDKPRVKRQNSVGFASVVIREYNLTIGDNPSVSYGPPISLDWEYSQLESVTLEQYEAHRAPRRTLRQMCMNYYTRRNVLTYKFGYDEHEVKKASKLADKVKRERAVTKYFLPYSKVEDFVSSAGRKAKRVVVKKSSEMV